MAMNMKNEEPTHFGYRSVASQDKANLVAQVFRSVAPRYDLMNDVMSLGIHRLWKRITLQEANVRKGQVVLDVAAGTGDLAIGLAKAAGREGQVIMTDINDAMLTVGRDRVIDEGLTDISFVQADAECLPFVDNYFDCITMAFGLRNVTNKPAALASLYRILKPGGKLLILEFSHLSIPILSRLYDLYSFHVIPALGQWFAGDKASYQYLVESIRKHPDQESMKNMMSESGFDEVTYFNLNAGIAALHKGYKY
jgi:demethylmenaquinone methyltransferase/2-methoxy-6-polyprenyl-1,4-benzoquinol methylase